MLKTKESVLISHGRMFLFELFSLSISGSAVSDSLQPHGLSCPPPGDLPDPGIEPRSLALQADPLPFTMFCVQIFKSSTATGP